MERRLEWSDWCLSGHPESLGESPSMSLCHCPFLSICKAEWPSCWQLLMSSYSACRNVLNGTDIVSDSNMLINVIGWREAVATLQSLLCNLTYVPPFGYSAYSLICKVLMQDLNWYKSTMSLCLCVLWIIFTILLCWRLNALCRMMLIIGKYLTRCSVNRPFL